MKIKSLSDNSIEKILLFSTLAILTSCSYNISMAHTQGTAEDVIDDNASNTPTTDISPNLNIPVKGL